MNILKIEIPSGANEIIHTLQDNGYEAFLVGGCVRDSILGRTVHDYDITTSATPNEMMEVFKDKRIIETGLQHGTITIVIDSEAYECTTYRIDGDYSDNRRPDSVTFTKSLIEDLKRRDFTINAMAYNDEVGLVDPFNGVEDIKNYKIRCVGRPEDRFSEDALRILRAIRFASQLEFSIDYDVDYSIHKMCKNLENISIERINSEFCKIVDSNSFSAQMNLYPDVFSLFIPETKYMINFQQNNPYHIYDVWNHTVHAIEAYECDCDPDLNPRDIITSLAIFFHDFGKPHCYQDGEDGIRHFKGHGKVSADMTNEIMKRLRFDNDMREKVVELVYYHDATFEVGKKYVKRWLNKIGEEQFRRLLNVHRADRKAHTDINQQSRLQKIDNIKWCLEEVLQENECFSLKDLAVNGNDLITIGYKPGKEIGEVLNNLLDSVISGEYINEKEKLLEIAERRLYD
ncbi:CCA tRNA nucleotidyltransferase [uncultured Eubacterium sp.]|uniref:CCA tRNA nucleotidyltransferase n=1 Tax=uncultured Eubacterium sp. TaxID=165185 RepID=UPI0025989880|nr:HD domain-containing protein [uncultured Eubacterium sp.]